MSDTPEVRRRLLDHILSLDAGITKPGIYGAEICQICGQLGTFSGFVSAQVHHVGQYHDYVCLSCPGHPECGNAENTFNDQIKWAKQTISAQSHRFCAICAARLEAADEAQSLRGPYGHFEVWICLSCRPHWTWETIRALRRRRYINARCPDLESLMVFALNVETTRLNMEEISATAEERKRLEAARPQRAREREAWIYEITGDPRLRPERP